jgi:hypothetical protein
VAVSALVERVRDGEPVGTLQHIATADVRMVSKLADELPNGAPPVRSPLKTEKIGSVFRVTVGEVEHHESGSVTLNDV